MKSKKLSKAPRSIAALDDHVIIYIGIDLQDYKACKNLTKFGLKKEFIDGEMLLPLGAGPVTRINIDGKDEKLIHSKVIITKRIQYLRRRDSKYISFDRQYEVFEKRNEAHKISLSLQADKSGTKIVTSPPISMSEENKNKLRHIIKLFTEIFGKYNFYDQDFSPLFEVAKTFDFELLPSGKLDSQKMNQIMIFAKNIIKGSDEIEQFKKRLEYFHLLHPKIVGVGKKSFAGYLILEIIDRKIVVLESLQSNNATYIFKMKGYEKLVAMNKQQLIEKQLFLKRIMHNSSWTEKIETILK